jgi:hypothetical protein
VYANESVGFELFGDARHGFTKQVRARLLLEQEVVTVGFGADQFSRIDEDDAPLVLDRDAVDALRMQPDAPSTACLSKAETACSGYAVIKTTAGEGCCCSLRLSIGPRPDIVSDRLCDEVLPVSDETTRLRVERRDWTRSAR